MIARLVFIIAVFLLLWLAFRYFRTLAKQKDKSANDSSKSSAITIQEMKPCAFCGVHMPEDEMLVKGKRYYCSYQHLLEKENEK